MRDPQAVERMFSSISHRYDALNHLLSAGLDRRWRRRAVELLDPEPGGLVLDLGGGTGDLSLELWRRGSRVVCSDFSGPMLLRADAKFAAASRGKPPRLPKSGGRDRDGRPDGAGGSASGGSGS